MPVVIKHGTGGVLFHEACGHGLEADLIAKGASVYAGKIGELVASPLVTLVDDGTMAGEWGTLAIRRRGPPDAAQRAHRGRRAHRLHVGLPARAQGGPAVPSGNGRRQSYMHLPMVRMTNTFVLDGTDDPGRHRPRHRARRVRRQARRRPGQHGHRRLRVRHDRGLPHRERRDHRAAARGQPDRQRPAGAARHRHARRRLRHGRPGHVRQGRPGRPRRHGQPTLRVKALTIGGTAA